MRKGSMYNGAAYGCAVVRIYAVMALLFFLTLCLRRVNLSICEKYTST